MTPPPDDVFDGDGPTWLDRAFLLGLPAVLAAAGAWTAVTRIIEDGLVGKHLGAFAVLAAFVAMVLTPTLWIGRHVVLRLAFFPDGFAGTTMGGRRFSMAWHEVRETSAEFRVRPYNGDRWRRTVRLDTTTGPLLLTDCLPRFDVLVARVHAATPHAFHHALPTRFERLVLNAKPPLSPPPPAAPGSGSASA